jgi:hypothetical protein
MQMRFATSSVLAIAAAMSLSGCGSSSGSDAAGSPAPQALKATTILGQIARPPTFSANTVPGNGDVNPYGVAFVPDNFPPGGLVSGGDILIANFNNSANLQGTGTTVVKINKGANPTVFYQDTSNNVATAGFSTALGVLSLPGLVVLGNVPSTALTTTPPIHATGVCNDLQNDVGDGVLTLIDRFGVEFALIGKQAGPWDLTVVDHGTSAMIFVSNVKAGTVSRWDLTLDSTGVTSSQGRQIASGYQHRCDPAAFVVGPTGLAYDSANDVLYVAATGDNQIFAVAGAGTTTMDLGMGSPVFATAVTGKYFHGPLGLVMAQNGDLISTQGDAVNFSKTHPSEIVETSAGNFLSQFSIDHASGSAFGIALEEAGTLRRRFAAVDDGRNVLDVWDF